MELFVLGSNLIAISSLDINSVALIQAVTYYDIKSKMPDFWRADMGERERGKT